MSGESETRTNQIGRRWHNIGVPAALLIQFAMIIFVGGQASERIAHNEQRLGKYESENLPARLATIEKQSNQMLSTNRRQWDRINVNSAERGRVVERIAKIEGQLEHITAQVNRIVRFMIQDRMKKSGLQ